jgi:hypothetical protein
MPVATIGWQELGVYSTNFHHSDLTEHGVWPVDTGMVEKGTELSVMLNHAAATSDAPVSWKSREVMSVDASEPAPEPVPVDPDLGVMQEDAGAHDICDHDRGWWPCLAPNPSIILPTDPVTLGGDTATVHVQPGITYTHAGIGATEPGGGGGGAGGGASGISATNIPYAGMLDVTGLDATDVEMIRQLIARMREEL